MSAEPAEPAEPAAPTTPAEPATPAARPATPPEPPYYAVIFSSLRRDTGHEEYAAAAEWMLERAADQPGFLGVDTARGADGFGITVSYWRDEASIRAWREHADHTPVRAAGRQRWYEEYAVHVARVERGYRFRGTDTAAGLTDPGPGR